LWGTVGGAWESGERAADAVLRRLGPVKEAPAAQAAAPPKSRPYRAGAASRQRWRYEATPNIMRDETR